MSDEYKPWNNPTKHVVVEFHLSENVFSVVMGLLIVSILRLALDAWRTFLQ